MIIFVINCQMRLEGRKERKKNHILNYDIPGGRGTQSLIKANILTGSGCTFKNNDSLN